MSTFVPINSVKHNAKAVCLKNICRRRVIGPADLRKRYYCNMHASCVARTLVSKVREWCDCCSPTCVCDVLISYIMNGSLTHRCGSKGDIVTQYFLCWLLHHPIALSSDIEPTDPLRSSGAAPSQMPVSVQYIRNRYHGGPPVAAIHRLLPKLQLQIKVKPIYSSESRTRTKNREYGQHILRGSGRAGGNDP